MKGRGLLAAMILFSVVASISAPINAGPPGSITINPGTTFHTVLGGGDLTFFVPFTIGDAYYNGSSLIFDNVTWSGFFGTLGFAVPLNATVEVTSVTPTDILMVVNTLAPATSIAVYAPARTVISVAGATSFTASGSNTTIILPLGVSNIDVKFSGGGGGSTYNYIVNLRRFENGTICSTAYNATVVYTDGSGTFLTVTGDGTPLGSTYPIYTFTYPTLDQLNSRTMYYPPLLITPIIPNLAGIGTYIFTVRDANGYLIGKTAYVDASKVVGGSDMNIGSNQITATQKQVYFLFQQGQLVHLTLRYNNVTVYDFGYFMPTTTNLSGNYLDLTISTGGGYHVGQYISVDAYWVGSDIVTVYGARAGTIDVNMTITDRANSTVIYSATVHGNTTWTVPADTARAYVVYLRGTHSSLSVTWTYVKILDPTGLVFPTIPGMSFWTLGGIPITNLISLGITSFFLFMFSYRWRAVGMMGAMAVASILWFIGWGPFWSWPLLALGWAMSIGWAASIQEDG